MVKSKPDTTKKIECSIGLPAYNEEKNIGRLLAALLNQKLNQVAIKEIIVVASGCTDQTVAMVKKYQAENPLIKLLIQAEREGKASAINLFIKESRADILVLESPDTLPDKDTIELLVAPLLDGKIGVTAPQVAPTNQKNNFITRYFKVFWQLHHQIALLDFKAGEMLAFRKIFAAIPVETATDETCIVAEVLKNNFQAKYVPEAKVYNQSPENFKDFLKVRRRQLIGYHHLQDILKSDYRPKTLDNKLVLKLFLTKLNWRGWQNFSGNVSALLLEVLAKCLAWYDWRIKKRNPFIWNVAETTKKVELRK